MIDTPRSVLAELALYLSCDARTNGSVLTDSPRARLVIVNSPNSLWQRVCSVKPDSSPEHMVLEELVRELNSSVEMMGNPPCRVASLTLDTSEGSLWRRALDILGYEPDIIRKLLARGSKPD